MLNKTDSIKLQLINEYLHDNCSLQYDYEGYGDAYYKIGSYSEEDQREAEEHAEEALKEFALEEEIKTSLFEEIAAVIRPGL